MSAAIKTPRAAVAVHPEVTGVSPHLHQRAHRLMGNAEKAKLMEADVCVGVCVRCRVESNHTGNPDEMIPNTRLGRTADSRFGV